ncbi:hypothetical protein Ancab_023635 [Ancistrocladus abbreviatus]
MEVQPQSSKVVAAVPDPNAALEGGRQSVPFPTQVHTVVAATRVPVVSAQHGYTSDVPDSNAAGDGGRHAAPFSTEAHVETAATRIPDDSAQHGHSSVRFSDALDVVPDSNELDFMEGPEWQQLQCELGWEMELIVCHLPKLRWGPEQQQQLLRTEAALP